MGDEEQVDIFELYDDLNQRLGSVDASLQVNNSIPIDPKPRGNLYHVELNVNHPFFKNEGDLWVDLNHVCTLFVFQCFSLLGKQEFDTTQEMFSEIERVLESDTVVNVPMEKKLSGSSVNGRFHINFVAKFNLLTQNLRAYDTPSVVRGYGSRITLRWTDRYRFTEHVSKRGTALVNFDPSDFPRHPNTLIFVVFNPTLRGYWASVGKQLSRSEEIIFKDFSDAPSCAKDIIEFLKADLNDPIPPSLAQKSVHQAGRLGFNSDIAPRGRTSSRY